MTWEKQTRQPDGTVTWERLNSDAEKAARQKFSALLACKIQPTVPWVHRECDCDPICLYEHARVGQLRQDGTEITVIDDIQHAHSPDGWCTDCHGRSPA